MGAKRVDDAGTGLSTESCKIQVFIKLKPIWQLNGRCTLRIWEKLYEDDVGTLADGIYSG